LVWADNTPGIEQGDSDDEEILYAYKRRDSAWSEPVNVSHNGNAARFPSIAVGPDDRLHLAWQGWIPSIHWRIFYSEKAVAGNWSAPETLAGDVDCAVPKIAVDSAGTTHVVWLFGAYDEGINYSERTSEGQWLPAEVVLPYPAHPFTPAIAVDNLLNVHAAWNTATREFYAEKPAAGVWSAPQDISNNDSAFGEPWLGAGGEDNVYCVWASEYHPLNTPQVRCRERFADGTWAEAERPCSLSKVGLDGLATISPDGELIIPGGDWDSRVLYVSKLGSQPFGDTVVVGTNKDVKSTEAVCCDHNGLVHLFWLNTGVNQPNQYEDDIFTAQFQLRKR
jgi:hypothetical protein